MAATETQAWCGNMAISASALCRWFRWSDGENPLMPCLDVSVEKIWAQEQLAFLDSVDPKSEDMIAYMKLLREFQTYDYKMHAPRLNEMADDFARARLVSYVSEPLPRTS